MRKFSLQKNEPLKEPCEICGNLTEYGFSLCAACDKKVDYFDEKKEAYKMLDGSYKRT